MCGTKIIELKQRRLPPSPVELQYKGKISRPT